MRPSTWTSRSALSAALLGLLGPPGHAGEPVPLDVGWRFHLGDVAGATRPAFDDSGWRTVHLPHDWSIEGRTSPDEASAGGGGFFPTGVGWYRRAFHAPEAWAGRRVSVELDGVSRNAEVWINGHRLGFHPYGYTPIDFDLTPQLTTGGENTLAVRVDNSAQPGSRWYTGSGIYRHVRLVVTGPVRLEPGGVFLKTVSATTEAAQVRAELVVRNDGETAESVAVEVAVYGDGNAPVAAAREEGRVPAGGTLEIAPRLTIAHPSLWWPEAPHLYRAVVRVLVGGRTVDEIATPLGLRTVSVSAERGFELNGRPVLLFGGNVHHDNGPLGAAAFDRAEERKVQILKGAGFNAVRTAHNPPSPAFLDACDRLGLLVVDEAFDGWARPKLAHDYSEHFHEWWRRDLEAMVRRDRNHPSVVMWSLGNEVYERGTPEGTRLAEEMAAVVRGLDSTRPVTAGINGMGQRGEWTDLDPLFASLDAAGYNYEAGRYANDHVRLPDRVMYGAESFPADAFASWKAAHSRPWVVGDFVWSALDYLGEAGIGRVFPPGESAVPHWEGVHYPWHGAACGDVDLTGWRRPVSHQRNITWDRGETLYVAVREPSPTGEPWVLSQWSVPPAWPSWTWPGHEGRVLRVDVYSRHDRVRLFLNDTPQGEKPTGEEQEFTASFEVPYAPGRLRVVGIRGGRAVEERALVTAGEAARIRLSPDRIVLRGDGQDLSFVSVEIVDRQGRLRPDAGLPVRYSIEGPASIAGIGSGDPTTEEPYGANPRRAFRGRALVVVRTERDPGPIRLRAWAPGLEAGTTVFEARP